MPKDDHSASGDNVGGGGSNRRDFLAKSAHMLYVIPLVVSYDISEVYDEREGYALARTLTPPPHHQEK